MSKHRISTDDLLAALQDVAESLDRSPRVQDIREHGEYDYDTYRRRFGGIGEALEAAGIQRHDRVRCGGNSMNEEDLITDLRRLGDELGRPPKLADVERDGKYAVPSYYNYFDSFADALEAAGFPAAPGNTIPDEQLVAALQELADDLGRQPTGTEMDEQGPYAQSTYRNRFGSWAQALEAADLDNGTESEAGNSQHSSSGHDRE